MTIERKRRWLGLLLVVAVVQVTIRFVVLPYLGQRTDGRVTRSAKAMISRKTYQVLASFGVQPDWVKERDGIWIVRLPGDLPATRLFAELVDSITRAGGQVHRCREDERTGRIEFNVARDGDRIGKVVLRPDRKLQRHGGRIALIIDDWGYGELDLLDSFLSLAQPLAFAVIPGLPRSQEAAARIKESGRPLLLHLPMEPLEGKVENNGYTILGRLKESEIRQRVRRALSEVPGAIGVNNHMGSKATVDGRVLSIVMDELQQAQLFFVDSRTNPESRAFEWASRKEVPAALNDLFLDVREEEAWVREKIQRLAEVASRKGQAVGIGHPKSVTLRVLKRWLPRLERRGYRFVPITELVR